MQTKADVQLLDRIVNKLVRRPTLGRLFYRLAAGPGFTEVVDPLLEKIDIPRIRKIISSNAFSIADETADTRRNWEFMQEQQRLQRPMTEGERRRSLSSKLSTGSGLWLNESMFNHSCTPNCTWSQIGDYIMIRTTRPVAKGEELCVSYCPLSHSYAERVETFSSWISPNVGFICQCPWCTAIRSNEKLRSAESEISRASKQASRLVSLEQTPMGLAAEKVIPSHSRRELIAYLSSFPLAVQHYPAATLYVMEGTWLSFKSDYPGALSCYQKAADIGHAVRGDASLDWAKDLWRVAGGALLNNNSQLAIEKLDAIWKSDLFAAFECPATARSAFCDLTCKYTLPWWSDDCDPKREGTVLNLARKACNKEIAIGKASKRMKKKKRR